MNPNLRRHHTHAMGKKSILEGLDKDEETTKLHFMKDLKE